MRRLHLRFDPHNETGVTALIVVLSLAVVFGMTVLVVDLGALIVKHRGLVNANDAAAVAAAASFARNEAQVLTNDWRAQEEADRLATSNVPDAAREEFNATIGLSPVDCHPSADIDACGTVKVGYGSDQALFFGPAIGLGDQVTAHGSATAIWGPAGGGRPAPITIHSHWLDECGVPSETPVTECAFWLDGRSGDGGDEGDGGAGNDSEWAWINLHQWDVPQGRTCRDVDRDTLSAWITGSQVPQVRVNRVDTPTFVCTASGRPGKQPIFNVLRGQEGTFKVFPVNDAAGEFAPPGQAGDKYDIVGFTGLRIEKVIRGDEDGEAGGTFPCSWEPVHLEQGSPVDLRLQPCLLDKLHFPGDPDKPFPRVSKDKTKYEGDLVGQCEGLDYCYNRSTYEVMWQLPDPVDGATIEWDYVVDPTPGACGIHELDENAVCLVVSWRGYRSGGINPGGGVDFGLRAVRLFA